MRLALALVTVCGCSSTIILDAEVGDVAIIVTTAPNGDRSAQGLIVSPLATEIEVASDLEVDAFVIPRSRIVTPTGDEAPDELIRGLGVRADERTPPPSGSCERCFSSRDVDPVPIWPGSACPLPRLARATSPGERAEIIGAEMRIDWPGECPCAPPEYSSEDTTVTFTVDGLPPTSELVATASGGAALIGEHALVIAPPEGEASVLFRQGLFPGPIAAATAVDDGYVVAIPEVGQTALIHVTSAGEQTALGTVRLRVDVAGYDPVSRHLWVAGQRGLSSPAIDVCAFGLDPQPSLRCEPLIPDRLPGAVGTFGALVRGEDGSWIARDDAGGLYMFEGARSSTLPQGIVVRTGDAGTSYGTTRTGEASGRWSFQPSAMPFEGVAALGRTRDGILECGRRGERVVIEGRPFDRGVFDGAALPPSRIVGELPSWECIGVAPLASGGALVRASEPVASACASWMGPCVTETSTGAVRAVRAIAGAGGAVWESTQTGLFRRSERGESARRTGAPPAWPLVDIHARGDRLWLFHEYGGVRITDLDGHEVGDVSMSSVIHRVAPAPGGFLIASQEDAARCDGAPAATLRFLDGDGETRPLEVDLGCDRIVTGLAWLGAGERYVVTTDDGGLFSVEGDRAEALSIDWDDVLTEEVEAAPSAFSVRGISAAHGRAFFAVASVGPFFIDASQRPMRARRAHVNDLGGLPRADLEATAVTCPDVALLAVPFPLRAETGRLFATDSVDGPTWIMSEVDENTAMSSMLSVRNLAGAPKRVVDVGGAVAIVFDNAMHLVGSGSSSRIRLSHLWARSAAAAGSRLYIGGERGQLVIVDRN